MLRAPTRIRAGRALVAALALAPLAGCDTSATPQDDLRATVSSFLQVCGEKGPHDVLPMLSTAARDQFIHATDVATGCATILRIPPPENASITRTEYLHSSVRVRTFEGGTGSVDVRIAGHVQRVHLTFGRAGWEIEGSG